MQKAVGTCMHLIERIKQSDQVVCGDLFKHLTIVLKLDEIIEIS